MERKLRIAANMSADLFHSGHVSFLKKVKNYFQNEETFLTVLLSSDRQILNFKKRNSIQDFECRKEVLSACKFVDEVVLHPDEIDDKFVENFDYLFHGDDLLNWDRDHLSKAMNLFKEKNKLILIPYTKGISTTQLIRKIKYSGI